MDNKRMIIAIAVSLLIWVLWSQFFTKKPVNQEQNQTAQAVVEQKKEETAKAGETEQKSAKTEIKALKDAKKVQITEVKTTINTEHYKTILSNKGARIESIKYGGSQIELVAGREKLEVKGYLDFPLYFSEKDFLSGSHLDDAMWEVKKAEGNEVVYSVVTEINGKSALIEKKYFFDPSAYSFDLLFTITNLDASELDLSGMIISSPDFLGPQLNDYEGYYNAPGSIFALAEDPEDLEKGTKGGGFFSKGTDLGSENKPVWAGISSRFISLVMIPSGFKSEKVIWDARKETKGIRTALVAEGVKIKQGVSAERKLKIALAEKKKDILASVDKSVIPAVDVNKWIEPIRWLVLKCLMAINNVFGNLGVSIVLFSILTKIIFLPLTIKSTNSMKKMSELSPKMAELKLKHKDNPQLLQKEMMILYKNAGVNPLGGCVPLLIQMPFFFALYSALSNSIDMWRAPFFLWMTDLSMPDTVGQIMGFSIKILPLIMVVTSFFQQKLSAVDTGNPSQKMMLMLMPVFMLYIFWSMPSGLVLYWIVQNVLQIAHQLYISRKPAPTAAAGGVK